jgi:hypothetical protein
MLGRRQRASGNTATRSEDLRKQHAPQTLAAEHAAADQEAHETAVLVVAALLTFIAFVLVLLLVPPFAQDMREEKPP